MQKVIVNLGNSFLQGFFVKTEIPNVLVKFEDGLTGVFPLEKVEFVDEFPSEENNEE